MVVEQERDLRQEAAAGRQEIIAGLMKVFQTYLQGNGVDFEKLRKIQGLGRLLTDQELKELIRFKKE